MKILVTGGGSEEPIDNVRAVCNFSTGRTASFLADYFASQGHNVTAIMSQKAVHPQNKNICLITYRTFAELQQALQSQCESGNFQAIVHAAAVSDYSPQTIQIDGQTFQAGAFSKIPPGRELIIKMRKNPKLVDSLKTWAGQNTKVIAFKLTSDATMDKRIAAVNKIFDSNKDQTLAPDFVVSNDLSEITRELHPFRIFAKDKTAAYNGKTNEELAKSILQAME